MKENYKGNTEPGEEALKRGLSWGLPTEPPTRCPGAPLDWLAFKVPWAECLWVAGFLSSQFPSPNTAMGAHLLPQV